MSLVSFAEIGKQLISSDLFLFNSSIKRWHILYTKKLRCRKDLIFDFLLTLHALSGYAHSVL